MQKSMQEEAAVFRTAETLQAGVRRMGDAVSYTHLTLPTSDLV